MNDQEKFDTLLALSKDITAELRRRKIRSFWVPGTPPTVLFAVQVSDFDKSEQQGHSWPLACAWKIRLPGDVLDREQQIHLDNLSTTPNAWCCRVIHSVEEAVAELQRLGI